VKDKNILIVIQKKEPTFFDGLNAHELVKKHLNLNNVEVNASFGKISVNGKTSVKITDEYKSELINLAETKLGFNKKDVSVHFDV